MNQLHAKENSIEAKLKELLAMKQTVDRLSAIILGNTDQDPKLFKLGLGSAPMSPLSSMPFSSINSYGSSTGQMLAHQTQSNSFHLSSTLVRSKGEARFTEVDRGVSGFYGELFKAVL